jgi:RND family efflux transporter MFP subunit
MTSPGQLPQQSGYKRYLVWLIPFIAVVALVLLMKASGNGQTTPPPLKVEAQLVNVMPVELSAEYQQTRLVVGIVEAKQTSAIGFELAGMVERITVDEGQIVKKGQVLARLDQKRLLAQKSELGALLTRAKSEATLAKLSLKRVVELVEKKLEPAQRLDESRESFNAAKAFVDEVVARLRTLEIELDKTHLLAPFDGNVTLRLIDQGAVVSAGQAIFNLQQVEQLQVRFAMPAEFAVTLQVGDAINLKSHDNSVMGTLKSKSGIRRLDTQTVDVMVDIDELQTTILPGDLLHLELKTTVTSSGFWMPRTALVSGVRGLWSLFVVELVDGEYQLVAKLVEMLHADAQKVFVRGAVKDNDNVVIDGVQRLVPGQKVKIKADYSAQALDNAELQ